MCTTVDRAVTLLTRSRFLTLATSDPADRTGPWVATVRYVVSDTGTLLFGSVLDARHSRHIEAQPQVAATVWHLGADPEVTDSVQMHGWCTRVPADEAPRLHEQLLAKGFPNPDTRAEALSGLPLARFQPGGTHRLYTITPTDCWVRDKTAWHQTHIDRRIKVPTDNLINRLRAVR
ncbi:pyridoxamine 5'-phosphate oxidase family protein [Nocardia pneumoniae]|uniref:pyridoxamine 5'-phosphate oxidase family protein n=1 Tax=Nocardia pneumoniae TaxID=228601 RepID=UPI0002E58B5A|nr:pyridoxamine 5'-phosphate oxidase family protein [Nocardia pneumoniae]